MDLTEEGLASLLKLLLEEAIKLRILSISTTELIIQDTLVKIVW